MSTTQVKYADTFAVDGLRLMEVSDEVLKDMEAGDVYEIRGEEGDTAVLVSEDRTYALKAVETSNTQYILSASPASYGSQEYIVSSVSQHLELIHAAPRTYMVKRLLQSVYLTEEEIESGNAKATYTLNELKNRVQASNAELNQCLIDMGAVEYQGYIRLLEPQYREYIGMSILNTITSKGWGAMNDYGDPVYTFPVHELLSSLEGIPDSFAVAVLHLLVQRKQFVVPGSTCSLDETRVVQFVARKVLRSSIRAQCSESDLMRLVHNEVPPYMSANTEMLLGIAILLDDPMEPQWKLLDPSDLSQEPKTRVQQLLSLQPKWKQDHIRPYIADLAPSGKSSLDAILLRHCRLIKEEGQVYCIKK